MMWKLTFLGTLLLFVSLGHARDTKNLDLTKPESEHLSRHSTNANNYDTPENCKGENMEWLTSGPVCDVYCDHQPASPSGSHTYHHRQQCQARMSDVIHDIIDDSEEGNLNLDRIAVDVTNTMRKWGSARLHSQEQKAYEGCYCKSGFARYGDNCVAVRDCPSRDYPSPNDCKLGNYEEWKDAGPGCDVYCPVQPNKSKWRSMYSNRKQVRCEGDVLRTLQEFEPVVTDLVSDVSREALSKHGLAVTSKLKDAHTSSNQGSVLTTQASGCYCLDGYLRYGDVCLKPDNCPTADGPVGNPNLCIGENEEFHKVSDHCEVYCDIQPTKYGRGGGGSINSCGRTDDFLRGFLPTVDEYKNAFDQATVVAKYAENITESLRSNNKQTFSDGCYCRAGHARYGYRCIRLDQCPMRKCHKSEVFQTQGPICEATCANLQYHHSVLVHGPNHFMPGCFCLAGQVRDERGRCIDPMHCWNYHTQAVSHEPQEVIYHYDDVKDEVVETSSPLKTSSDEEKPIYNRKILETLPVKDETPIVDGFKTEPLPVVTVTKVVEETPATVTVPLIKEKVVVVEEISVPVVAIYDKP